MSRQYNMYNVQLSEFWKQRCLKESMHNAPYLGSVDSDDYDVASEAPSRAPSQLSTTSTVTQQKVRVARSHRPARRAPRRRLRARAASLLSPTFGCAPASRSRS